MTTQPPGDRFPIAELAPVSWAVMQLGHQQRGLAATLLAELGLFPGQELMLAQLWGREGRSQKELGELLGLDHSTVAKSVQRLERAGLVRRARSAADGRVTLVELTDAGARLEGPIRAVWAELEARWANSLTHEQRAAAVLLAELNPVSS